MKYSRFLIPYLMVACSAAPSLAQQSDLEILEMAGRLMELESTWDNDDDKKCEDDIETDKFTLSSALEHASMEKAKEHNHHNTAMQYVRFAIDELMPEHGSEHTLMEHNNAKSSSGSNIRKSLEMATEKIKKEKA